jgi:hypothetical protein
VSEKFDSDGVGIAVERDAELDSGVVEALDDDEFRRRCSDMDDCERSRPS